MKIADYLKERSATPIDMLIDDLQNNNVPITLAKRPGDKTESEVLIDHILASDDAVLPA